MCKDDADISLVLCKLRAVLYEGSFIFSVCVHECIVCLYWLQITVTHKHCYFYLNYKGNLASPIHLAKLRLLFVLQGVIQEPLILLVCYPKITAELHNFSSIPFFSATAPENLGLYINN